MSLRGRSVSLRPPTADDAPVLAAILAEPAVAAWWGDFDLERVKADLLGGDADEHPFVIEHDGAVVGYIQAAEENEPEFRHAGIDLFLRTDLTGSRPRPGRDPDAGRPPHRRARPPPPDDRSGRRQQPRDRGLREGRLPSRGAPAPLPADAGRALDRRPAHGAAGRRTGALRPIATHRGLVSARSIVRMGSPVGGGTLPTQSTRGRHPAT